MIRFLVVTVVVMGNIVWCPGSAFVLPTPKANRWMRKSTTIDTLSDAPVVISNWKKLSDSTQARLYGVNVTVNQTLESSRVDGVATAFAWSQKTHRNAERRKSFPVGAWLAERPSVGVALSGGGMRAASCSLGWLRALHHANILKETRYLSSNSGATWITLPLAAKELLLSMEEKKNINYEYYLGKYVPPEKIRGSRTELGFMGEILAKSNVITTGKVDPSDKFTAWVESIDANFVAPLNVSSFPNFYKIMQDEYLVSSSENLLNEYTFPFPIYVATAYPNEKKPGIAVPFEFTPLYSGIPVDPREFKSKKLDIGGGYTQYHVFNSRIRNNKTSVPVSDDRTKDLYLTQFPSPEKVLNIAEITGISSSFFGAGMVQLGIDGWKEGIAKSFLRLIPGIPDHVLGFPNPTTYEYWSPESGGESKTLGFVDGGIYDNTGVLALVRRGCKCIIACVATDSAVTDADSDDRVLKILYDLAALFGKEANNAGNPLISAITSFLRQLPVLSNLSIFNDPIPSPTVLQIFDENDWEPLVAQLKTKWREGVPQVARVKNVTVKPNPKAGVYKEGKTVDLIVCLNSRVNKAWLDKLGDEALKKKISPGRFGPKLGPEKMLTLPKLLTLSVISGLLSDTTLTDYFPYYSTYRILYDNETVNLMAHLSSFSLIQGLQDVGFNVRDFKKQKP